MIFRPFRPLLDAIKALTLSVERLAQLHEAIGPALDRLDTLERTRHQFEAECEGMLLKADGKLKAAASAEQRERQISKANKLRLDPFGDPSEEVQAAKTVLPNHAPPSEEERLQALRLDVAPLNSKTLAQRAKFGVR